MAAFNCGFHEHSADPAKDTWKPALPKLVRHPGVPLVLTSYTLTEATKDLDLLLSAVDGGVDVVAGRERNPFRSQRPIRDFEFDRNEDCFFSNNYYSIVKLKQEE